MDVFDELAEVVHKAHAVARTRAAADLERTEEIAATTDVIRSALSKESQAVIQAGRGEHAVGCPIASIIEAHHAVTERRVQMEADLDIQNGDLVWRVMTEDYGEAKAGDVVEVPRSEVEFVPSREATKDEVNRHLDACYVPCVGNAVRIAAMLHGGG